MKTVLFLITLLFAFSLIFCLNSFANTSVNISGNAEGSNASVSIHNTVNSTSNSSSNSTTHTSVHIESNGQVQDYTSDKPGNIDIKSNSGNAEVHISDNGTTITSSPTITPEENEASPTPTSTTSAVNHDDKKSHLRELHKSFILQFEQSLQAFFRRLFFHI